MVAIEMVNTVALHADRPATKKDDIVRHSHAGGNPYWQMVDTRFHGYDIERGNP